MKALVYPFNANKPGKRIKMQNNKKFQPDTLLISNVFLIALAIFILGVQAGIKHGRELQLNDMCKQAEAENLILLSCSTR